MREFLTKVGKKARSGCAWLLICALLAPGCVHQKPEKDAFMDHWEAMAQRSKGYSPTPHPRRIIKQESAITAKNETKIVQKPTKKLPTARVSLRMYNTDLRVVLRALARAANQNIVLSSSIPGGTGKEDPLLININVDNAPWNQTFKSILTSNNLVYKIEGDIIEVMTLSDMQKQGKLEEEKNKRTAVNQKMKTLEPFETYKVEINYSDLASIQETLSALCGATVQNAGKKTVSTKGSGQPQYGFQPSSDITRETTSNTKSMSISPLMQQLGRQPGQMLCTIVADQHSNSIILQAPHDDAKKIISLIEKIDQPQPQVRLKAYIVEASQETAHQIGIQWGGLLKSSGFQLSPGTTSTTSTTVTTSNTPSNTAKIGAGTTVTSGNVTAANSSSTSTSNVVTPIFGGGTSGNGFGVNNPASLTSAATGLGASGTALNFLFGRIGSNMLEAQLTALAAANKIKILSTPTITTMENLPAFVENGTDVPYVSTSQNGTNVQWAKATLKLEIVPHVVDGTNLRLKIMVKDDQVDTTNNVDGNPYIYKRETQSNLVIEDGDTVIISGLTRNEINKGDSGVPYLQSIPLLGWAFKSKSSDVVRKEMLIFITPTILKEKPIAPVPSTMEQANAEKTMALPQKPETRP